MLLFGVNVVPFLELCLSPRSLIDPVFLEVISSGSCFGALIIHQTFKQCPTHWRMYYYVLDLLRNNIEL